jgi:dihydroxy-acid dehydratase
MATSADKGAVRDVSRIEALQDSATRADQPA